MKASVRKGLMIAMAAGFLAGLCVLFYPVFSNIWNQINYNLKFEDYKTEAVQETRDESLTEEWEKAYAYNEALEPIIIPDSFVQAEGESAPDDAYLSCLNTDGDGMMGYVSIPKIDAIVPIYHGTSEEVLQKGAGHVQGSSLPVGGESTHAVIAAHRGLPGATLFTDLDLLEEGDQFYLYILDDVLAYEVDQIEVVKPENSDALQVTDGEDLVTLLTCTPYGVNSHRLLVRGHRIPYEKAAEEAQEAQVTHSIHTNYILWAAGGVAVTAGFMFLVSRFLKLRSKRREDGARHRKGKNADVEAQEQKENQ